MRLVNDKVMMEFTKDEANAVREFLVSSNPSIWQDATHPALAALRDWLDLATQEIP